MQVLPLAELCAHRAAFYGISWKHLPSSIRRYIQIVVYKFAIIGAVHGRAYEARAPMILAALKEMAPNIEIYSLFGSAVTEKSLRKLPQCTAALAWSICSNELTNRAIMDWVEKRLEKGMGAIFTNYTCTNGSNCFFSGEKYIKKWGFVRSGIVSNSNVFMGKISDPSHPLFRGITSIRDVRCSKFLYGDKVKVLASWGGGSGSDGSLPAIVVREADEELRCPLVYYNGMPFTLIEQSKKEGTRFLLNMLTYCSRRKQ